MNKERRQTAAKRWRKVDSPLNVEIRVRGEPESDARRRSQQMGSRR